MIVLLRAGLLCACPAPAWIPASSVRFLVSDSNVDLLRWLLTVRFLVCGWTFVRLPGSSLDSGFWFRVPDRTCSAFRFPVFRPLVRLHCSGSDSCFWFPVQHSGLNLLCWLLNLRLSVSSRSFVPVPGSSPDTSLRLLF